ncbi:MAG TPA: Na+/H+ antiporter [Rubrobacter sp.]|nr:Na+/H+ antiporter [Rubrobacter sp.]
MNQIESLIFLLAAAALFAQLARLLKVPYPILLVVGGLALGFVPGLPEVEIPPEVIFLVFLPPLLNSAAFSSSPLDLRAQLRPIVLLAVGLVLATMGAVAVIAHALIGLPWAAAFVLGAILAPTDPVAAEAIFGRLGVPERVGTVVGGESLVNDGTGLVAFRVAVAAVVSGAFSVWEAGLSFLLVGGSGLFLGLALAWFILPQLARLRDPSILITFSVLIPYAVYILAEEVLHVSGILAVVTYGLYQGWKSPRLFPNASTRLQTVAFWGVLVFLLEALLFILVGQQLPSILADIEEYSVWEVLFYAALVYAAVVMVRFAWFFTTPYFHPVFDRLLRSRYLRAPWQERLVMSWSGMRGAVSLAAALAVPLSTNAGDPFPGRNLIVFLTFAVILATLVLQGLTLEPLIAALRLEGGDEADKLAELRTRLKGALEALARLEQLRDAGEISQGAEVGMREYYEERARRYEEGIKAGGTTDEYAESSATWRKWRRELIAAERDALLSSRDAGEIGPEAMRRIERDLDLEESRIGG